MYPLEISVQVYLGKSAEGKISSSPYMDRGDKVIAASGADSIQLENRWYTKISDKAYYQNGAAVRDILYRTNMLYKPIKIKADIIV